MRNAIRLTALAALLFTPAVARAQQPLGGWRGLETGSLDTVYVTDDAGRQTEGKLLRLDTDALVLLVNGTEQRFEAARVQRIDKRGDSLRNGALIGAAIGVRVRIDLGGDLRLPRRRSRRRVPGISSGSLRRRARHLHRTGNGGRRDDCRTHACVRCGSAKRRPADSRRPATRGTRQLVARIEVGSRKSEVCRVSDFRLQTSDFTCQHPNRSSSESH